MTPHSSLRRRQKDLYWYPWNLALPRSRDTLLTETAPVKKDLHVTSSLLSSGDEVANNRGIDSSNVSLMLVGNRVRHNRIQTSVLSKRFKKKHLLLEFVNLSSAVLVSSIAPQCFVSNSQTFKTFKNKKENA